MGEEITGVAEHKIRRGGGHNTGHTKLEDLKMGKQVFIFLKVRGRGVESYDE